jgi:hypothetical protein
LGDKIKDDAMGGACGTQGKKRNENRLSVGKCDGKRSLRRPCRKWKNGINGDVEKVWDV